MNKKIFFFLLFTSLLIVLIWFRSGRLFATAEEGAIFYSPSRTLDVFSNPWQRSGTGQISSFLTPTVTMVFVPSLLEYILPNYIIQAVFFLFIFASGLVGMYLFSFKLTNQKLIALFASLFYLLNLYTQSQIFARALTPNILLWSYLPLFFYLLANWLEKGNKKDIILLLVSTLFYAHIFSAPANLLTFSFFVVASFVYHVLYNKSVLIIILKRTMLFCFAFILLHAFWLYPYFSLAKYFSSSDAESIFSLNSLRGVSAHFSTSQILILRQTFFFENGWEGWYKQVWVILLSLLIVSVVILGIFYLKKSRNWKLLLFLLVFGWFICKGSNPPLGDQFYSFLFTTFPKSVIMRNPYEKFGLVFLIPYSVFFAAGVKKLIDVNGVKTRIFLVIFIFLSLGVLVHPIWRGKSQGDYAWVNVPDYYKEANIFINSTKDDGRILVLPLVPSHSSTFTWGYRGFEPSTFFFDKPAIGKEVVMTSFREKYKELLDTVEWGGSLEQYLQEMNVRHIVVRKDLRWDIDGSSSPEMVRESLAKTKNILYEKSFGDLDIYKYQDNNSQFVVSTDAKISYLRVSPQKYKVVIKNAKEPLNLTFKETFHSLWEAKIEKEILPHQLVYEWANGWYIKNTGDYTIDITFKVWPWD